MVNGWRRVTGKSDGWYIPSKAGGLWLSKVHPMYGMCGDAFAHHENQQDVGTAIFLVHSQRSQSSNVLFSSLLPSGL